MTTSTTTTGTVKWFDEKNGYGFILHPAGDVFVHFSEIDKDLTCFKTLKEGEPVSYERMLGLKGWAALNLKRLGGTAVRKPEASDGN